MGWDVVVVDRDQEALRRMKEEIYPKRYGAWDEAIQLHTPETAPVGGFDVIMIGTPPDVHMPIATKVLQTEAPKVLQIEKPLCSPTLDGMREFVDEVRKHPEITVLVGFNHLLAENTKKSEALLAENPFGKPLSIDCEFRSHWKNIFSAHPWLSGPQDTYLGFWKRGGGAGGEHIHGINLWQHMAHVVGAGRVTHVEATFDYVAENGAEYDRSCFLTMRTESGLVGRLAQDVFTQPKKKFLNLQCEKGSLLWANDVSKTTDEVHLNPLEGEAQKFVIEKTRTEEFGREAQHIQDLLDGKVAGKDSPIHLQRGLDTMLVLAAAHQSHAEGRRIIIDYSPWQVV